MHHPHLSSDVASLRTPAPQQVSLSLVTCLHVPWSQALCCPLHSTTKARPGHGPPLGLAQPDGSSGLCSLRAGKRGGQEGDFEQLQHLLSGRDLELAPHTGEGWAAGSVVSHQCWQDPRVFRCWQGCQTGCPPASSHPGPDGTVPAAPLGLAAAVTFLPLGPGRCRSRSQPQPLAS